MLPRVILHNGVSVDGRIDCPSIDVGLYYELAAGFAADAMISGSNTILAASFGPEEPDADDEPAETPASQPGDTRPWLVIVDSRGRVRNLKQLRNQPYWRDVIMLCSRRTPEEHLEHLRARQVEHIVAGEDQVDLRQALEALNARYGIRTVRVDSGGVLNGVLLRAGLVDEVSVLISPALVGGTSARSIYVAPDLQGPEAAIELRLIHLERLRGDTVWLRYEVAR